MLASHLWHGSRPHFSRGFSAIPLQRQIRRSAHELRLATMPCLAFGRQKWRARPRRRRQPRRGRHSLKLTAQGLLRVLCQVRRKAHVELGEAEVVTPSMLEPSGCSQAPAGRLEPLAPPVAMLAAKAPVAWLHETLMLVVCSVLGDLVLVPRALVARSILAKTSGVGALVPTLPSQDPSQVQLAWMSAVATAGHFHHSALGSVHAPPRDPGAGTAPQGPYRIEAVRHAQVRRPSPLAHHPDHHGHHLVLHHQAQLPPAPLQVL